MFNLWWDSAMWKIAEADLNVERTRENGFFLLAIFLVAYIGGSFNERMRARLFKLKKQNICEILRILRLQWLGQAMWD